MSRFNAQALITLLLAAAAAWPAGAAVQDAEFAVRWDPRQGGPATPQEALHELRLKASAPSHFEVQYFDFTRAGRAAGGLRRHPAQAPDGRRGGADLQAARQRSRCRRNRR